MNEIIKPISGGLMVSVFTGRNAETHTNDMLRSAMTNIFQFNQVCCVDCKQLMPGRIIEYDESDNGRVAVDLQFNDPKSWYAIHCDHEIIQSDDGKMIASVPPEDGYILPSRLWQCNKNVAERQLKHTRTVCYG